MTTQIVGSKEMSETERGQMQDQSPSSVYAKTQPEIPNVSPPNVVVPGLDHRDTIGARTSGSEPYRDPWHANPSTSQSSPAGKVPHNNLPLTRPATPGNAA